MTVKEYNKKHKRYKKAKKIANSMYSECNERYSLWINKFDLFEETVTFRIYSDITPTIHACFDVSFEELINQKYFVQFANKIRDCMRKANEIDKIK